MGSFAGIKMELLITIENHELTAKLPENEATRQFQQYCPINETFQKSGDHEYFCRLTRGINVRDLEGTSDIHGGGIYYFADWKALSFVYKEMSISPYKVVYLGEFTSDVCGILSGAGNKVKVRMEAEKDGR